MRAIAHLLVEAEWLVYALINYAFIGSDKKKMSPGWHQTIIWTYVGLLLIVPSGKKKPITRLNCHLQIGEHFLGLTLSWRCLQMETFSALLAIWVNNGEAGDLRCHRAFYDVILMWQLSLPEYRLDSKVIGRQNMQTRMSAMHRLTMK